MLLGSRLAVVFLPADSPVSPSLLLVQSPALCGCHHAIGFGPAFRATDMALLSAQAACFTLGKFAAGYAAGDSGSLTALTRIHSGRLLRRSRECQQKEYANEDDGIFHGLLI